MGLRTQASSLGGIPVKTQKQILRKQVKLSKTEKRSSAGYKYIKISELIEFYDIFSNNNRR